MNIEQIKAAVADTPYDFLREDPRLGKNIILLTLGGSHAYGMEKEDSDLDIRGITLNSKQEILLGKQFIGEIYHNMGCAYARLFQMEEAIRCFEIAYGKLHTMGAVKSLLYAVYMEHGVDAFVEKAKQLEVDEERQEEIYVEVEEAVEDLYDTPEGQEYKKLLEEKQQGREEDYQQGMEHLLEQLTAEYHKSTGY